MATIQERKDKNNKIHYRVMVRIKGADPQQATFERKTDAKLWAQQTEAAIREGRHFKTAEAKKHTLGDLVDRYIRDVLPNKKKCIQRQGTQLLWWKEQIGSRLLADVTPALIGEQRDKLLRGITRRGKLRTPATTVRYMAALSHAFSIAVREWGWLEDSPMRKVVKPKEPRGRVRFLSPDERSRLLEACKKSSNPLLYTIVVLALSTGMRKSELMNLRWKDIDFSRNRILLEETKNGERGSVPLVGHALEVIKQLDRIRRIDTDLLFPSRENPRKPIDIRRPWENALKAAGIKDFLFHCCRHSFASELAMNGASLVDIQNLLRHKQISVTTRYSHLTEDHTTSVVANMNEKIFAEI